METIKVNGTNGSAVETAEEREERRIREASEQTALDVQRTAGSRYVAILTGERLSPLPKGTGSAVREECSAAKRDAVRRLDALNGHPGRGKDHAEARAAWYLAGSKL